MTEHSEIGLRILGEIPTTIWETISRRLRDDIDVPTDDLADEMVAALNEGQRWAIARHAIVIRIESRRRQIARRREVASTVPRNAPWRTRKNAARAERLARETAEKQSLGLPPEASSGDVIAKRMRQAHQDLRNEMRHEFTLELTNELLETEFLLDGQRVRWADATVAQHEARAITLESQGLGTLETALRHRLAVDLLEESGRPSLAEISRPDAA